MQGMVDLYAGIGHTDIYGTKMGYGLFEHGLHFILLADIAFKDDGLTTIGVFGNPIGHFLGFGHITVIIDDNISTFSSHGLGYRFPDTGTGTCYDTGLVF